MKHFILMTLRVICLATFAQAEAAADVYPRNPDGYMPWATIGREPCRVGAGTTCTLEAALRHSKFPQNAQEALRAEITSGSGERVLVLKGEKFDFVQFRYDGFTDKVVTAWPSTAKKYANRFETVVDGRRFEAFIFIACLNWAMRSEVLPALKPIPSVPLIEEPYPVGGVPEAYCGDDSCNTCD